MDIKEIKGIIDLMRKNGLSEFEYEKDCTKIRIRRGPDGEPQVVTSSPGLIPAPTVLPLPVAAGVPLTVPQAAPAPAAPAAADPNVKVITSPMVGTFYATPSPDSPNFVAIGSTVKADTVVCIIEAMKVMNEIQSELAGTIVECLVASGTSVEFGQPLFRVKVG